MTLIEPFIATLPVGAALAAAVFHFAFGVPPAFSFAYIGLGAPIALATHLLLWMLIVFCLDRAQAWENTRDASSRRSAKH